MYRAASIEKFITAKYISKILQTLQRAGPQHKEDYIKIV